MRVLILSTTTGYQLRAFDEAAARLGAELVFATDRCHQLDDPWRDRAIPVRFYEEAEGLAAIERAAAETPFAGVLVVGDRPVPLAALAAERLRLPGNPLAAARATGNKLLTRQAIDHAGLPAPWFFAVPARGESADALARARFPCVIKPLAMAASRGVIRVDDLEALHLAFSRLQTLLARPDVQVQRNPAHRSILIEEYIPGDEFALEGVMTNGALQVLAVFDKPDPLEGPFFEETIYVTPSRLEARAQDVLVHTASAACRAIGLRHGPVHVEARVNDRGVYVLEIAARPIGGLCARALRFVDRGGDAEGAEAQTNVEGNAVNDARTLTLEELLLRHAIGESVAALVREARAAGVMMMPVPEGGYFKYVQGVEAARAIQGIDDLVITAKPGQRLVPLPEGTSYPGFIFASAATPEQVEGSLRQAHALLRWVVDRSLEVV